MIYDRRVGLVLFFSILSVPYFMALVGKVNAQPIGTWTLTSSLNVARGNFPEFLVPLPDGRILAIGGFDSAVQDIASVEVYDRSTESWNFTDSLGIGRYNHSSTVLLNERILVTGGNSIAAETTAKLYDPTTETFSPTGAMGTAYKRHTATRLPNGKVLVAGGVLGAPHDSADLYDPTSGTFTPTDSMGTPRQEFTATLLQNGKVLVAGGQFCGSPIGGCNTTSAELYDPATETFSSTGSFGTRRSLHTATHLQDGRVLIVGGTTTAPGTGTQTATAELYDPNSGTFSSTGNLLTARREHTATILSDGRVLIAGGRGPSDVILSSVEIYDPATGMFSAASNMNVARADHGAVFLRNGRVLVAGGLTSGGVTNSAELFDLGLFITVDIDIKPGSDPNSINCTNENEVIPTTIQTTDDFDATTVDHTTVIFEGATEIHIDPRSGEPRRHEEDVDDDGDIDLVFHFRLGETALDCNSTEGTLTGETFGGQSVEGTDSVNMVGS